MQAIISHDIDHISVSEHLLKDSIVPKFIIRNGIELAKGKISMNEYVSRHVDLFKNKWQNIEELIDFNKSNAPKPPLVLPPMVSSLTIGNILT